MNDEQNENLTVGIHRTAPVLGRSNIRAPLRAGSLGPLRFMARRVQAHVLHLPNRWWENFLSPLVGRQLGRRAGIRNNTQKSMTIHLPITVFRLPNSYQLPHLFVTDYLLQASYNSTLPGSTIQFRSKVAKRLSPS